MEGVEIIVLLVSADDCYTMYIALIGITPIANLRQLYDVIIEMGMFEQHFFYYNHEYNMKLRMAKIQSADMFAWRILELPNICFFLLRSND